LSNFFDDKGISKKISKHFKKLQKNPVKNRITQQSKNHSQNPGLNKKLRLIKYFLLKKNFSFTENCGKSLDLFSSVKNNINFSFK
jgi:hypothetical protein